MGKEIGGDRRKEIESKRQVEREKEETGIIHGLQWRRMPVFIVI